MFHTYRTSKCNQYAILRYFYIQKHLLLCRSLPDTTCKYYRQYGKYVHKVPIGYIIRSIYISPDEEQAMQEYNRYLFSILFAPSE